MRILLDISMVGNPAGLGRWVRELALDFPRHDGCETTFCACGSFYGVASAAAFLREHPEFDGSGLAVARLAQRMVAARGAAEARAARAWRPGQRATGFAFDFLMRGMNLFANRIPASALRSADIFYSTFGRLTYQSKRATRAQRFLTVHDMLPRIMPELFTPNQCAVHARIINSVGPRDWVVCVSESTRNDLCRLADVRPEQTFVIPPGSSSDRFYPCADPERRAAVRAKYGIPAGRYLLSVATLEPRKNLAFLVRCFARWTRETGAEDLCLVLAGGQGWKYDAIERVLGEVGELRGRIILTGYVDDQDLAPLYSECLAFVYPSLYEGFGLPVLEAMKCGAAILSSASSSIPEVIGDAGMLVDPRDESAMCQALDRLCGDANLRSEMSARALQRATEFSWSACVDKHLAAFRHALASRPS